MGKARPFMRLQTTIIDGSTITVAYIRKLKYAPFIVINRSLRDSVGTASGRERTFKAFANEFEATAARDGEFLRIDRKELIEEIARFSGEERLRFLGGLASPALASRTCGAMGAGELATELLSLVPAVADVAPAASLAASTGAGQREQLAPGAVLQAGSEGAISAGASEANSQGSRGSALRNGMQKLLSRAAEERVPVEEPPPPAERPEDGADTGSAQGGVEPEGAVLTVVRRTLSLEEKRQQYRLKPADMHRHLRQEVTDFGSWSENSVQLNRK